MDAQGLDDIKPEDLAKVLSILTGGEFTPDALLSNAHALLALLTMIRGVNVSTSRACMLGQRCVGQVSRPKKTVIAGPSSATRSLRLNC